MNSARWPFRKSLVSSDPCLARTYGRWTGQGLMKWSSRYAFRTFLGTFACMCIACHWSLGPAPCIAAEGVVSAIRNSWANRLRECRSARYVVATNRSDQTRIYDSTGESRRPKGKTLEKNVSDTPARPGRIEYSQTFTIIIEGERIRFELKGAMPGEGGKLHTHQSLDVSDGTVSKHLDESKAIVNYPTGEIYKTPVNLCATLSDTLPLRWTFVPFVSRVSGLNLDKLRDSGNGTIDGHEYIVLTNNLSNSDLESYWLDPKRGYRALQYKIK